MSKCVKVLGLDLSTATGMAVVRYENGVRSVDTFGMIMAPKKVTGWPRVNAIAADVLEAVHTHKPDLVSIEGYGFSQMSSIVTLAEIGSIVRFLLWQEGVPFLDVPPSSLKKFLTGQGNAKKEMMILHVFQKYGITVKTNDEADAVALGMFGLCAAGAPHTKVQKEVVAAVTKLHLPLGQHLQALSDRCN